MSAAGWEAGGLGDITVLQAELLCAVNTWASLRGR